MEVVDNLRPSSSLPYPRVQRRIQQVGQEIHRNVGQSDGEDASFDEVVVAIADRLDREPANSRPCKDSLSNDGAGEQSSELQTQYGDDRNHRIAQGVPVHHCAIG